MFGVFPVAWMMLRLGLSFLTTFACAPRGPIPWSSSARALGTLSSGLDPGFAGPEA